MIKINNNTDTIPPLWDKLYPARVPEMALHTSNEIKLFGTYTTVRDTELDKKLLTNYTRVEIPVARMVDHFKRGYNVKINMDDTLTIYDDISKHLYIWKQVVSTSVNKLTVPVDDLLNFDEFADHIFKYIKSSLNTMPDFMDKLKNQDTSFLMSENGMSDLLNSNKPNENVITSRESYSSFFKSIY